ncbi:MAG: hypothetical protein QOI92_1263 [Chloroflexota bacterium]|jgi:RNA polymerase sigma-70 factor (ECF subfamily)|nr:hypothetical protein [Chloroflexota bacterium]
MHHELVRQAQRGDADAFTTLVASAIDGLYGTARLILRSDDRAQDAVQDALIKAWLGIRGLREPDRFDAWLRRLVVHACYDASRRESHRRVAEIPALEGAGPATPDTQGDVALHDQLERGFRRLAPDQRAVLVVHHYLDLADGEAAQVLGIPIGTMKSRLSRATSALRASLEADERRPILAKEGAR